MNPQAHMLQYKWLRFYKELEHGHLYKIVNPLGLFHLYSTFGFHLDNLKKLKQSSRFLLVLNVAGKWLRCGELHVGLGLGVTQEHIWGCGSELAKVKS